MRSSALGSTAASLHRTEARPGLHEPPAIDLVHLAKQTMGDGDLEADLLRLFARQARHTVQAVEVGLDEGGEGAGLLADRLHMLCGSGRAIGAWAVADEAQRLEARLRETEAAASPLGREGLAGLGLRVERACLAIADLLGGRD